ncbi:MAG TPA: HAD family hydrolase [Terriglobales bacterium]|jgi:FMN phosphatase YigB (HAD superfamily)|nr:HAD family hydrolase [Terriglobales bacterium]
MKTRTYPNPKPYPEKVRLVILDLDAFLYPYDKAYRNAVLRAWRAVEKEYGLPIFRKRIAQKLIEEAKEQAKKNPDNELCRHVSQTAERLESMGYPGASVIGMLEAYRRSRRLARSVETEVGTEVAIRHNHSLDPPYKHMIAMAFNLRLLQDQTSKKKPGLTRDELRGKILEGEKGVTRLWNKHMGSGFIRPDAGLVRKIQRLTDAGIEIAVLSHSFKHGEGQAMEKLEKLGLKGVIPEHKVFGLEEISPDKKGKDPEAFEKVLAAINNMRDPADPIKPSETIMAEDTIVNLHGAKKAGMQTVWVPRSHKDTPDRPSPKLQKKLASVDYIVDHTYATPHQFLDALDAAIRASK